MADKRVRASQEKIEKTLAASIRAGLTPARINHYPDGRFEVIFGGESTAPAQATGWEDF